MNKIQIVVIDFVRTVMRFRIDVLLLLTTMLGVLIQSLLFLFGVSCSGWPMWIAFAGMTILLASQDRKRMFAFAVSAVCVLLMTAYTFSYVGTDVFAYHFPMQDLLRRGWNPVYQATFEEFGKVVDLESLSRTHTLFLPRLCALCGALISSSTGLYVADAFLNYLLLIVLFVTCFNFAKRMLALNNVFAVLFAFSVVSTTKVTAILSGYVDYAVYASTLIMIFSVCLYWKDRRLEDIVLTALAMTISAVAKSTGLVVVVLFALAALPFFWRDRKCWTCGIVVGCLVLVIGFSPLATSTIHYGCPLYPTMSFSAAHPAIDITNDFTGNADALRMGYFARSCFAWVSPKLTTSLCAIAYGKSDFNPMFSVCGGVDGFGTVFRLLLGISVLALLFSRKNIVTLLCVFFVLTTLVTPLKYVGFARYFLQVWAIPPLAVFNFVANPIFDGKAPLMRALRCGLAVVPVVVASLCLARSLAFYGRTLGIEKTRQVSLSKLTAISGEWVVKRDKGNTYSLKRRLDAAGVNCEFGDGEANGHSWVLDYDSKYLWVAERDARAEALAAENAFPIVNSVGEIVVFPWIKAYTSCPRVLWYKEKELNHE